MAAPFTARWALAGLQVACCLLPAVAQGAPLTLERALAAVDSNHPQLRLAEAARDAALAAQQLANARDDLRIDLTAGVNRVRPALADNAYPELSDNSVALVARKTLYDFGRSAAAERAAKYALDSRQADLIETREQRRLQIMRRFFDVLLADMQAQTDDQYMAVAYVNFDNGRDRYAAGQISSSALALLRHRYETWRVKRSASRLRRRVSRLLLANAMNRPNNPPDALIDPALKGNDRPIPAYRALRTRMARHNPRLISLQDRLEAARERLASLRAERGPTVDAEITAADYANRPLSGRDEARVGVVLNWPLYQGGRVDAKLAQQQARFAALQARANLLKMELTQMLLETYLQVKQLRDAVRQAVKQQAAYTDLALDKARGAYEEELKANLGNSMAASSASAMRQRKSEYQLALALEKLQALVGAPLGKSSAASVGKDTLQ
ncbi:MAG TPA: hypothetical protein DEP05_04565 [Betaproteobacteria bacterium]|nr:hypothetical protein [Betaproteobacteria bacterium]